MLIMLTYTHCIEREIFMYESTDILMKVIGFGLCFSQQRSPMLTASQAKTAYNLAKKHNIAQLFCYTAVQHRLVDDEQILAIFKSEYFTAIMRDNVIQKALTDIETLFENENIAYIPLKGAVIRYFYPESWTRSSRDIDILVKNDDHEKVCELLSSRLNYKINHVLCYDTVFNAPNGICIEIHHALCDGVNLLDSDKPLLNVWDSAYRDEKSKSKRLMDDDLFLYYNIYHTAKHFICGGCGLRALIDFWILNNKFPEKSKKLQKLLEEYNLIKFCEKMEKLCRIWFLGETHDEESIALRDYIAIGGQEGNQNVRHITTEFKKKSRFKYYLSKVFIPISELKPRYPVLERWSILFPFCTVHRWFSLLFGTHKDIRKAKQKAFTDKQNAAEALHNEHTTKEKVDAYQNVINIVGF